MTVDDLIRSANPAPPYVTIAAPAGRTLDSIVTDEVVDVRSLRRRWVPAAVAAVAVLGLAIGIAAVWARSSQERPISGSTQSQGQYLASVVRAIPLPEDAHASNPSGTTVFQLPVVLSGDMSRTLYWRSARDFAGVSALQNERVPTRWTITESYSGGAASLHVFVVREPGNAYAAQVSLRLEGRANGTDIAARVEVRRVPHRSPSQIIRGVRGGVADFLLQIGPTLRVQLTRPQAQSIARAINAAPIAVPFGSGGKGAPCLGASVELHLNTAAGLVTVYAGAECKSGRSTMTIAGTPTVVLDDAGAIHAAVRRATGRSR